MVKHKFQEIGVEQPEAEETNIESASAEVVNDFNLVTDRVAAPEVPLIEKFWQLLETTGYECW